MFEVEIKIKLKNRDDYVKKILGLGAKYECNLIHTDIYYNMPESLRNFEDSDEALRIRRSQEIFAENPLSKNFEKEGKKITEKCNFTYKGPKLDKLTKSRVEHVTQIGNLDNMVLILDALGFRKVLTVYKERIVYDLKYLNNTIEILIDKIQYLDGCYSELEILCETEKDMDKAKDLIFDLLEKLGYTKNDSIRTSYMELVLEKLSERE